MPNAVDSSKKMRVESWSSNLITQIILVIFIRTVLWNRGGESLMD